MSTLSLPRPATTTRPTRGLPFDDAIAPRTGPLTTLAGRRVAVLADLENLRHGAADLGRRINLDALAASLRGAAASCRLHAFHSSTQPVADLVAELRAEQWTLRVDPPEDPRLGRPRRANIDNMLLLWAGHIVSRGRADDLIIVASGDGDLVNAVARYVAGLGGSRAVATCSLSGSTSHRLDARRNPLIVANIEIGRDCLIPLMMRGR